MNTLARFFASHRRRRRLARTAIAVGVIGGLVTLALNLPNTTPRKFPEATEEGGTLGQQQQTVRMTVKRKRGADRAIDGFVRHALLRQDPGAAWRLATPGLRAGTSLAEWKHGDLPVTPYPVGQFRRAGWSVAYSYPDVIGADVTVMPKVRSTGTIWVYAVEVKDVLRGKRQRWLVDSWTPIKAIGGGTVAAPAPKLTARERAAARAREAAEQRREERAQRLTDESRLSRAWFFLPLGLLALIVLVPITLGVRSALESRRAERRYLVTKK